MPTPPTNGAPPDSPCSGSQAPGRSTPVSGRVSVGHPVDVASGEFFTAWNDVEIWGCFPLIFRRYYNTRLLNEAHHGALGPGWRHSFERSLVPQEGGFLYTDQDGTPFFLDASAPPTAEGIQATNLAASMDLRREGDFLAVYHWHDWQTEVEKVWFKSTDAGVWRLHCVSQPSGVGVVLDYDAAGRVSRVIQTVERRKLVMSYTPSGQLQACHLESPFSGPRPVASYTYDAAGRLVSASDALGTPMEYAHDEQGRIIRETTASQTSFWMRYDGEGRCVETRGVNQYHLHKLRYSVPGQITTVTDSLGGESVYIFNAFGQVTREVLPNGARRQTFYDDIGRVIRKVDALGAATAYEYDAAGNLCRETYANGSSTRVTFNEHHQPLTVEQGEAKWLFRYEKGAVVEIVDPLKAATRYVRGRDGSIREVVEPSGNRVVMQPNADWSALRISDSLGVDREERYDDRLELTAVVEPDGSAYRFAADAQGRLTAIHYPDGTVKKLRYTPAGYVDQVTQPDGAVFNIVHNAHGCCERVTDPLGHSHSYHWDTEGRLTAIVNPKGETARIGHDAVGNEVEVRFFDGRIETAQYDQEGRCIRRRRPDGRTLELLRDQLGNVTEVKADGATIVRNEYGSDGALLRTTTPDAAVQFEYDLCGKLLAEVQGNCRVDYRYTSSGALASRTVSRGRDLRELAPLELEYDLRKRLVSVRKGGVVQEQFRYDARDLVIRRDLPGATEEFAYDLAGHMTRRSLANHRDGSPEVATSFAYDTLGNLVGCRTQRSERTFSYDAAEHLVASSRNGARTRYAYDPNGNLSGVETPAGALIFEYGAGDVLQRGGNTSYEHDDHGRVQVIHRPHESLRLHWNELGQLGGVEWPDGRKLRFGYDGLGRRTWLDGPAGRKEFLWSGDHLLAEIGGDGGITEYLLGGFAPVMIWQNGRPLHCINSHLGVPQELVDNEGMPIWWGEFDDWGRLSDHGPDDSLAPPLRFPGQYADSDTGLHYNRFRYYDPDTGQYLTPDPLGFFAGPNLYRYGINPVNWTDVLGLSCGIPRGQQSVYVLEAGNPPQVVYVGITSQSPHARLAQHRARPPGGLPFDRMRVIASGPPTVPNRAAARNIEASVLHHAQQPPPMHGPAAIPVGPLRNAARPVNSGYYHSYNPNNRTGNVLATPVQTTNAVNQNVVTII